MSEAKKHDVIRGPQEVSHIPLLTDAKVRSAMLALTNLGDWLASHPTQVRVLTNVQRHDLEREYNRVRILFGETVA